MPTSEPKKNPPSFLFSSATNCSLPVSQSSPFPQPPNYSTLQPKNSLPNSPQPPSLHCTALPLAPPMALSESACILVNSEACQSAARRHRDSDKSLCTLFTFLSLFNFLVLTCLSLTYPPTWPSYSPFEFNDAPKHGAALKNKPLWSTLKILQRKVVWYKL